MLKRHGAADISPASAIEGDDMVAPALSRLVPSAVTVAALCCGMTAIELAMIGRYRSAAVAIMLAAVFDGLDGRAARWLNSASLFGAELDSLSDFVSFGVAPAVLIYTWSTAPLAALGWIFAVFFAVCCGLRLARFNTQLHAPAAGRSDGFFTGVPAPAGAALGLLPMFAAFAAEDDVFRAPILNASVMLTVGLLMISRLPTLSLKQMRLAQRHLIPAIIGFAAFVVLFALNTWLAFAIGTLLYAATLPVTPVVRRRRAADDAEGALNGPIS